MSALDEKILKKRNRRLRNALEAAALSLETIRDGTSNDLFLHKVQIRGYANSRAIVARKALEENS